MIKSKNIYIGLIGIVLIISMVSFVYAIGSSYSSSSNNELKNNDDIISIQESNPNIVDNDAAIDNNAENKVTALAGNSNRIFIETFKIYTALSFLKGSNENPGVHTKAFAIGEFLIDTTSNKLTYNIIEYDVENETRAEILGPAMPRINSNNLLLTLPTTAGYKTGIWNYPQSIESDLLRNRIYVNIYTSQNPNGEIRGQIIPTKAYIVRRLVNVPNSNTYSVNISNFSFSPNTITIKKGDTVIWKNYDSGDHTVHSDIGNELNSGNIHMGKSYSHKFNTVGNYTYHCNIHPTMHGTIIVENW